MENYEVAAAAAANSTITNSAAGSSSPPPSSSSPNSAPNPPPPVVISPCAACKILRRRCADKCVLAPYFPPTEPAKFTIAHRVFGASNIIKFLQVYLLAVTVRSIYGCFYPQLLNSKFSSKFFACAEVYVCN